MYYACGFVIKAMIICSSQMGVLDFGPALAYPLSLTSKMYTVMNFQNLKVVHLKKFFEEELVKVENGK